MVIAVMLMTYFKSDDKPANVDNTLTSLDGLLCQHEIGKSEGEVGRPT